MPWIIAILGNLLLTVAGSFLAQMLVGAGVAVATYTGVDFTITMFRDQFVTASSGLSSPVLGMMALMKIGSCVSMMISAVLMRMTLNGFTSGTFKSWVKK